MNLTTDNAQWYSPSLLWTNSQIVCNFPCYLKQGSHVSAIFCKGAQCDFGWSCCYSAFINRLLSTIPPHANIKHVIRLARYVKRCFVFFLSSFTISFYLNLWSKYNSNILNRNAKEIAKERLPVKLVCFKYITFSSYYFNYRAICRFWWEENSRKILQNLFFLIENLYWETLSSFIMEASQVRENVFSYFF